MNKRLGRIFVGALALCLGTLHAQSASKFKMQKITFKGSHRYADAELLSAIGMKQGTAYSQAELEEFASKLNRSGVFLEVRYMFTTESAEFDLKDNPRLLPLRLENIVWLTPAEVDAELKRRVPLFKGSVPDEGSMSDDLAHAMETMSGEKGVHATITATPLQDESRRFVAITYQATQPRVEYGSITFEGAGAASEPALRRAAQSSVGKEFTRTSVDALARLTLRPAMDELGYLRATFGEPALALSPGSNDTVAKVTVKYPVSEGAQYRIGKFVVRDPSPLATKIAEKFKTGEVVRMSTLRNDLAQLGGDYTAKGYMGAKVRAEPNFDEVAHTVSYEIQIVPGELYRMRNLEVKGLDDGLTQKVREYWKLKQGDTYLPTYVRDYLKQVMSKVPPNYVASWQQQVWDDEKAVDVSVEFKRFGGAP